METFYSLLGVSEQAGPAQIKSAYKHMAKRFHPDLNPGNTAAEESFKKINQAYQTLSDPWLKHIYDQKLVSARRAPIYPQRPKQHAPPHAYKRYNSPPSGYPGRGMYSKGQFLSRQNKVATAWAFGIMITLGFLVFGMSAIQKNADLKAEQAIITQYSLKVQHAESLLSQGAFQPALNTLDSVPLDYLVKLNKDNLKPDILSQALILADESYAKGNWRQAAELYNMLRYRASYFGKQAMLRLAECYENATNFQAAIQTLDDLLIEDPENIPVLMDIGRIYRAHLLKSDSALPYYEQAEKSIKDSYERIYGKAYMILVNAHNTPDIHYDLFMEKGKCYLEMENTEKAIDAFLWARQIRPKNSDVYTLLAKTYLVNNEKRDACKYARQAQDLGAEGANHLVNQACQ